VDGCSGFECVDEADCGWAAGEYNILTGKQNPVIIIWIAIRCLDYDRILN
jgi:hypothetical protein